MTVARSATTSLVRGKLMILMTRSKHLAGICFVRIVSLSGWEKTHELAHVAERISTLNEQMLLIGTVLIIGLLSQF